jgi:DeoR/GlpR family transcriptional regulator of sugar metabolism
MQVPVPEAARLLGVSEHTVRRRLRSGELQGHQVASSGGFLWMVEIPDELQVNSADSEELAATKTLLARAEAHIASQESQLEILGMSYSSKPRQLCPRPGEAARGGSGGVEFS